MLPGQANSYCWNYGSIYCALKGGEAWRRWNARLRPVLTAAQANGGSFPPIAVYAGESGDNRRDRCYMLTICGLRLELYYRYFPPLLLGH